MGMATTATPTRWRYADVVLVVFGDLLGDPRPVHARRAGRISSKPWGFRGPKRPLTSSTTRLFESSARFAGCSRLCGGPHGRCACAGVRDGPPGAAYTLSHPSTPTTRRAVAGWLEAAGIAVHHGVAGKLRCVHGCSAVASGCLDASAGGRCDERSWHSAAGTDRQSGHSVRGVTRSPAKTAQIAAAEAEPVVADVLDAD